jgi:hypothetical protein
MGIAMTYSTDLYNHYKAVRERIYAAGASYVPKPKETAPEPVYSYPAPRPPVVTAIMTLEPVDEPEISLHEILRATARASKMSMKQLTANVRGRPTVKARHVYFYLARLLTVQSSTKIGYYGGLVDHSTVLHGIKKVKANMEEYRELLEEVRRILGINATE